jgi:hypothetical protein
MGIGIGHIIYIAQGESNYLRAKISHGPLQSFAVVINKAEIQYLVLMGASLEGTTQKGQPKREYWIR